MIEMKGVKKSFNGNPVLRDITLTVNDGESVVLIGRSGSGKSVALRNILGLIAPDEGTVIIDGIVVNEAVQHDLYKLRRNIGMLFQNAALWDSMSVYDNIALALREHKLLATESEIRDRIEECLELVGLEGTGLKMPSELSGGMRKRVGLARAIATKPKYMLYDEPTTGLDPIMSRNIDRLIKRTNEELNVTSLTITHDMVTALYIADRIVMLHRGEIVFSDTSEMVDKLTRIETLGELKELIAPEAPEMVTQDDLDHYAVVRQLVTGDPDGPIQPKHRDHYTKGLKHQ